MGNLTQPREGGRGVGSDHLLSYFTVNFGVPFSSLARSSMTSVVGVQWRVTARALFSLRGELQNEFP